jgi:hypothetical protein
VRTEHGNVSVLMLAGIGLAVVLCLAVARVGSAAILAARADTAADADNGASLVSCTCGVGSAEVVVALGRAHGRARAVVDADGVSRVPARGP